MVSAWCDDGLPCVIGILYLAGKVNGMTPINLKEMFGKKYRIGLDPAAFEEPNGKKDLWYHVILCKYGEIYPVNDKLLAIHSKGGKIYNRLSKLKGVTDTRGSDDGEGITIFPLEMFKKIAEIVQPRRKRVVSDELRQHLSNMSRKHGFKAKNTPINDNTAFKVKR